MQPSPAQTTSPVIHADLLTCIARGSSVAYRSGRPASRGGCCGTNASPQVDARASRRSPSVQLATRRRSGTRCSRPEALAGLRDGRRFWIHESRAVSPGTNAAPESSAVGRRAPIGAAEPAQPGGGLSRRRAESRRVRVDRIARCGPASRMTETWSASAQRGPMARTAGPCAGLSKQGSAEIRHEDRFRFRNPRAGCEFCVAPFSFRRESVVAVRRCRCVLPARPLECGSRDGAWRGCLRCGWRPCSC